ncbi:MAG: DedA family protein [Bacteroidetes bacterium]|nr:MAG: DedA family protein [Bacteroidota bacterium]
MQFLIDFLLHLDKHLDLLIKDYGTFTYIILFLIIFIETGVIVMPFLPGDSLLFAVGAFCAKGSLSLGACLALLFFAAVLGDTVNYWIGKRIGSRVVELKSRWIKQEHLLKTQQFYEQHGGKTIILARFLPIVRTFAPFIAGVGKMEYRNFLFYNLTGGAVWVLLFTLLGFFFGNLPFVQKNFSLVIVGIVALSVVPPLYEYWRSRNKKEKTT